MDSKRRRISSATAVVLPAVIRGVVCPVCATVKVSVPCAVSILLLKWMAGSALG